MLFSRNRRNRWINFACWRPRQNSWPCRNVFLRALSHSSALRHLARAKDSAATDHDLHTHLCNHSRGAERVGTCLGKDNQRRGDETSSRAQKRTRVTAELYFFSL